MKTLNKRRVSVWNHSETLISKSAKLKRRRKARVDEQGFDPWTSGLWAQHASTAPLCYVTSNTSTHYLTNEKRKNKERKKCTKKQRKVVCICPCVTFLVCNHSKGSKITKVTSAMLENITKNSFTILLSSSTNMAAIAHDQESNFDPIRQAFGETRTLDPWFTRPVL